METSMIVGMKENKMETTISFGLYKDEKKMDTIVILGLYRDNGKENGNYYYIGAI